MISLKWVTNMTAGEARAQGLPVADNVPDLAVLMPVPDGTTSNGEPVAACWRDPAGSGGRIHGPLMEADFAKHHDPLGQTIAALAHYLVTMRCAGLNLDENKMVKRTACWDRLWNGRVLNNGDVFRLGKALLDLAGRADLAEEEAEKPA